MEVVKLNAEKPELIQVPKPPVYLTDEAKKHWYEMGNHLCSIGRLKKEFLTALEVFSEAKAEFEFASRQIRQKNKEEFGTGYIQTYKTGATNVTTEMVVRNAAIEKLLKCFKIFGADPKSEKELGSTGTGQLDLFEQLMQMKQNAM